jgi:hypothetical protein
MFYKKFICVNFLHYIFLYLIKIKLKFIVMKKNYLLIIALFSFVFSYSQCDFTISMTDTYGDGWNGASVELFANGTSLGSFSNTSAAAPNEAQSATFSVNEGDVITSAWTSGSYDGETAYTITDSDENVFASVEYGNDMTEFTVTCPPPPSCLYSLVMTDSYGDGWNGASMNVLVDGIVVLEGATFSAGFSSSVSFEVSVGSIVTTSWVADGSYPSETSYSIYDATGNLVGQGALSSIEDDSITGECPSCANPIITAWSMTIDGLIVDGTNQEGIVNYQLEYSETTFTPGDGTATVIEFDFFPHQVTGLSAGTTYFFAMQSNCGDSVSDWIGSPDEWTTQFVGSTAESPIVIESIPYSTSDDTINYGDDYTNTATGCDSGNGYYLGGDDVVYLYTAASTMTLNVNLAPSIGEGGTSANYAGMYVYENAEDVGVNCWIAELELGFSSDPASFEVSVTEGSTYYFVISTWAAPQNIAYDLSITELLCGAPANLTLSNVTSTGADVSWDAGEAVSWEYVLTTTEGSSIPTEAGEALSEPNVSIVDLNPISAYTVWVRAICDDGSASEWTSVAFTTLLQAPGCGESISQYEYPNGTGGSYNLDDTFDIANDWSASLLFSTTAGDQDADGTVDEVTVTISGSTENNFDWVFVTNGAGELLYGPISGTQDEVVTSTDGTINVYLAADGSVMGGPISFDVSCAGLSVNDFDLSDLRIYPNPVNGDYVTIQSSVSGEKNIELYDITGKKLINTILNSDKLDVSSVSSGIYLVKVTIQGQTKVSRLIIR